MPTAATPLTYINLQGVVKVPSWLLISHYREESKHAPPWLHMQGVPEAYNIQNLSAISKDITDQCSSQKQVVKESMAKRVAQPMAETSSGSSSKRLIWLVCISIGNPTCPWHVHVHVVKRFKVRHVATIGKFTLTLPYSAGDTHTHACICACSQAPHCFPY